MILPLGYDGILHCEFAVAFAGDKESVLQQYDEMMECVFDARKPVVVV